MAADGDIDLSSLMSELSHMEEMWIQKMEQHQSQAVPLQAKVMAVKESIHGSQKDEMKRLEVLWRRVKTTTAMLAYLKSKSRLMAVPHLDHASFAVEQVEGSRLVDAKGVLLSGCSRTMDVSSLEGLREESWIEVSKMHGSLEEDANYVEEILKDVQIATDVMELLVRRIVFAESETANEKKKVCLVQEEIKNKSIQIEGMSQKLEEMERFATGTNSILNEMMQKVEELVEETSRQRQRAETNEQELCRVKRDFESLKSYVSSLITVRETLLSSEKQVENIEKLFERLIAKTAQLEAEKSQKETEVQKLMTENLKLSALLDKKEAQLLAMNEQCKVMALNASI